MVEMNERHGPSRSVNSSKCVKLTADDHRDFYGNFRIFTAIYHIFKKLNSVSNLILDLINKFYLAIIM